MTFIRKYLYFTSVFLTLFNIISCQNPEIDLTDAEKDAIINIFGTPNVSSTTEFGAPIMINEKSDCICVPYYNCDGTTMKIIKDGKMDGFGLIDIRFGKNKCDHYLEVCCKDDDDDDFPSPVNPIPDDPTPSPLPIPTVRPTIKPTTAKPTAPPTLPPSEKVRCGQRNANGIEFNINGNTHNEAEYGEFPWMVAILRTNWIEGSKDNLAICGGSLIHPEVILTAAHCVHDFHPTDIKVRAGEWDTQTVIERYPYQEQNVKQIIVHKNFDKKILLNDIALLVLNKPVHYAANVKPVCLPETNYVFTQKECFASGWGKTLFGKQGNPSVILKKIDLPIVPNNVCQDNLRKTRLGKLFNLHQSFICAGGIAGKDTCTGDGGSPLVCPESPNVNRYTQAGIVAWGIGCNEENVPGVYANVALFRDWIDSQMLFLGFDTSSYTE